MSSYNCPFADRNMPSSSLVPKRGRNLAERLVSALAAEIRRGALLPGDRLPTEAQSVNRFSVSRTVVREALSQLQASGLVQTRHGVGTFVSKRRRDSGFRVDAAEIGTVMDVVAILELRIGVESEAAALAARRSTKAQVREMRAAIAQFEANLASGADTVAPDLRFHMLIGAATGNPYFESILGSFGARAIPRARVNSPGQDAVQRHRYLTRVNREHEDICNAIARGDTDGARAAMRTHLSNSRERLQRAGAEVV
jgi:GntR family transcriptional regulator, transcriptional repressor for pyruvate dehydrogenase complex